MIEIRPAVGADVPAVAALLEEMDRFYGTTAFPPQAERERVIATQLFGPVPAAFVLLALDGDVAGLAAYSFLWPAAGVSRSLYLKELYVRQGRRRGKVGQALMARLCTLAAETGCSRVEWTTDRDNEAAQEFYAALGTKVNPGKLMYRADGVDIARLTELSQESAIPETR